MQGQRVLVTGAGGFIGSHVCERLVMDGANVRALCRYTSPTDVGNLRVLPREVVDQIEIDFADLLDRDAVARVANGCDCIVHLAASVSVPYSYVAPREVLKTNVEGTLNVLTAAREKAVGRVVHMSSSEVYGTAQYIPIDEDHPLRPQSPYAASKVGADKLAEAFQLSFGLPVVIARPFNNYGPRQSLRAVIPTIIAQALSGNEVQLGATTPTRDFVFVTDTADALVRLAGDTDHAGETFNIAVGREISVGEVVETVGDILGRPLSIVPRNDRMRPQASEVFRLVGDAGKISAAVGWRPVVDFRSGVAAVIDWISAHAPSAEVRELAL